MAMAMANRNSFNHIENYQFEFLFKLNLLYILT